MVLWVDDDLYPNKSAGKWGEKNYKTFNFLDKNVHIILKTSSATALAYLRSPLFKNSV